MLIPSSAYLVELWPYAQRSRGIGVQQIFGKCAGFFSTNVNPIAMKAIGWKFLAIYCGWITFEFLFIFFFYPETYGRTLEELTFCKLSHHIVLTICTLLIIVIKIVFEDKELADKSVIAVEKQIHHEDMGDEKNITQVHAERKENV